MEKAAAENLGQSSATCNQRRSRGPCYLLGTCLVLGTSPVTSNHSKHASHLLDEETAVQRGYVPYPRSHS